MLEHKADTDMVERGVGGREGEDVSLVKIRQWQPGRSNSRFGRDERWGGAFATLAARAFSNGAAARAAVLMRRMQLLPASFKGTSLRSTDGTVYCVVEGHGQVRVGEDVWNVGPRDVFVVPSWAWHDFSAAEDLILFSFSDRPLQKQLGLWREQRA